MNHCHASFMTFICSVMQAAVFRFSKTNDVTPFS
jgi:hypothetical protein